MKKKYITVFFVILAAFDFCYSIFNNIEPMIEGTRSAGEVILELLIQIYYLLPVFALIFASRKVEQTEDKVLLKKIKKIIIIYCITDFLLGFISFYLNRFKDIYLPVFPFGLFHTHDWLYFLSIILKYHFGDWILLEFLIVCFWFFCFLFIKRINCKLKGEKPENPEEMNGKLSAGFKFGIANIILLCIQTYINIEIVYAMYNNTGSGEQAIGIAFLQLILVAGKILIDLILLPVIFLAIAGLKLGKSKKEIEQKRKNRRLGIKINTVCLITAILELLFLWCPACSHP